MALICTENIHMELAIWKKIGSFLSGIERRQTITNRTVEKTHHSNRLGKEEKNTTISKNQTIFSKPSEEDYPWIIHYFRRYLYRQNDQAQIKVGVFVFRVVLIIDYHYQLKRFANSSLTTTTTNKLLFVDDIFHLGSVQFAIT